ncbi:MAG: glucose dehydrogenase [Acidobacteria bacterium]|nr:MAG: glucose dehydrogenase [Acidobacteriota bacterium]
MFRSVTLIKSVAFPARVARTLALAAAVACAATLAGQTASLRARVYASGFTAPLAFIQDPTDRTVQFVVEQSGRIRAVRSGLTADADFLDLRGAVLSGGERGLLGLAFAPDTASGRVFVNFTNRQGDTSVVRFRRAADPLTTDPASRFDLRWGGGPDGYLYIGMGDGGSGNDPDHRAQNPRELLGKMLRIDVAVPDADANGYRVPPDNPFTSGNPAGTRPEIWDFGMRNPWRFSFDDPSRGGTGALVIGDVGQDHWEEIDYEPRGRGGRNYGWRNREGSHDNVTALPPAFQPLIDPIFEYDHSVGQSITGGYVYRGSALGAAYVGRYFFADFVQGRVWSVALTIAGTGAARASGLL